MTNRVVFDESRYTVDPVTGCWLWTGGLSTDGYGRMSFGGRQQLAHRVMYQVTRGPIPRGMQIDHTCGVRHCVRPEHLAVVTVAENARRGQQTILTPDQVREIRGLLEEQGYRRIAARYGVSVYAIRSIAYGRTWKDVT